MIWCWNEVNFCAKLQIFYFIGFGFFCLESLLSIWVIQVFIILSSTLVLSLDSTWAFLFDRWFYICSKYTCTSAAVARLQRWSVTLLGGPWWQHYDVALANVVLMVIPKKKMISSVSEFLTPFAPCLILACVFLSFGLGLSQTT